MGRTRPQSPLSAERTFSPGSYLWWLEVTGAVFSHESASTRWAFAALPPGRVLPNLCYAAATAAAFCFFAARAVLPGYLCSFPGFTTASISARCAST